MKNDDFENIEERANYRIPDDFFDTITEKTLEKARRRQLRNKRRVFITWTSAAAVVIVIIVFSGLNTNIFLRTQEQKTVVQTEEYHTPEATGSIMGSVSESFTGADEQLQGESDRGSASTLSGSQSEESIESLLATLSEEELFALAEQISAELLINELIEE